MPAVALADALGAVAGVWASVVLVLVAVELAGVLCSEVAAYYTFDRFVVPRTLHVQFGAAAVAGTLVWVASRAVDVTADSTLALVLAAGVVVHYALFVAASENFRSGSVRTLRDVARFPDRGAST